MATFKMMMNYILTTKTTLTKHEASDEEFCSGTSEIMLIVTSQFWHVT